MTIAAGDLRGSAQTFAPIPTHDGQGDVIFYDGFEGIFNRWFTTPSSVRYRTTARARNGRYAFRLNPAAAGATRLDFQFGLRGISRYGLEFSFLMETVIDRLEFVLHRRDGTNITTFTCYVAIDVGKFQYLDSAASTVDLDTSLSLAEDIWHTLKMVVDLTTNTYTRFVLDSTRYEVARPAGEVSADANPPQMFGNVFLNGDDAVSSIVDIDDAFVTINEPPN